MGRAIAKAGVIGGFLLTVGLAALLITLGVPVGVAATGGALLVGLGMFLGGRAMTNINAEGVTGSLLFVVGTVLLLITAVSGLLLGKEYWPGVNALLLFGGSLVVVFALGTIGIKIVNRLVPVRGPSGIRMVDMSTEQGQETMQAFFGDSGESGNRSH